MSVDPVEIPRLVKAIGPADVAIGSRSLPESTVEQDGIHRMLMGRTFNFLVSTLTNVPFRDTQCGFKAFRTPLARVLFHLMRVQRFAFDVELLCLARELRMEIAEVSVEYERDEPQQGSDAGRPALHDARRLEHYPQTSMATSPALTVMPSPGERRRSSSRIVGELYGELGPNYPIMITSEDQSLVLLPLCDPIEVQQIAARLRKLTTRLSVRERSVSFAQLRDLVPFQWIDSNNDGFVVVPQQAGLSHLGSHPPAGGWESLRSDRGLRKRSFLYA